MGKTTALVNTIMLMPSKAVPKIKYTTVSTAINAIGLSCMALTHSANSRGIPVNAIVFVKKAAPANMNMIMQLERAVPIKPSQKLLHVKLPPHAANANAPTTP